MALAVVAREYPSELRADFQQYYSLNIDGMGDEYSFRHAAELLVQLPQNSRVFVAVDPDNAWTDELRMLSYIEFRLRALEYSLGGGKGQKPKPLYKPGKKGAKAKGFSVDEVKEILSRRRIADGD